jgi:hypothetical protein
MPSSIREFDLTERSEVESIDFEKAVATPAIES